MEEREDRNLINMEAHTGYHVPPEGDPETRPRVGLAWPMNSVTFRRVGAMVRRLCLPIPKKDEILILHGAARRQA